MQPSIPWCSSVSVFVIERTAIIYSLKCTVPFSLVVTLLSLAVTHWYLLPLVVLLVVTICHSLYHSLSLAVIRCHSFYHSLPLVVIRCHSLLLEVPLVCLFINDLLWWRKYPLKLDYEIWWDMLLKSMSKSLMYTWWSLMYQF